MSTTTPNSQLPEWFESLGLHLHSNWEIAFLVLPELDYGAQLMAIRLHLSRNRQADEALASEIEQLERRAGEFSGLHNEHAVDRWLIRLHDSVYQEAAHSMAAVGMLAPLVESIFYQTFQGIRKQFFEKSGDLGGHARWEQSAEDQWDCHFVWNRGRRSTNLVEGIMQLVDAVGMSPRLPGDLRLTLQALFEYRNMMFHCGFEWPINERLRFKQRIEKADWPSNWFKKATIDDKPWIFYLSDDLVQHCLATIDQVLEGVGAFICHRILRERP